MNVFNNVAIECQAPSYAASVVGTVVACPGPLR